MSLTFRDMQVISTVIRTGSVTEAANALGISQPAVSIILRHCSEEVGFPLFVRKQGRLQPTDEAKALVPDIQRLFECADRVQRLVEGLRNTSFGVVRIATIPAFAGGLLASAIVEVQRSRPGIQVSIETMTDSDVAERVAEEQADLGLVLSPAEQRNITATDLSSTELLCIAPSDHPLAGRDSVSPADLVACQLVSFGVSHPLGYLIDHAYRSQGLVRSVAIQVSETSTAVAMVGAGLGVAIVDPFSASAESGRHLACLKFLPTTPVSAQVLLPKHGRVSRPGRLLIDALRAVARTLE